MVCTHLDSIREIIPSAKSCDPREPWGRRYIDQERFDFSGQQTIHRHASSVAFEDRKW